MTESDVVDGARSQQRGAIGLSLRSNHIREPSTCKFRRSAWISPRTCSRFTGSTRPKRSSSGNGCDGARCWFIGAIEKRIKMQHRSSEASQRVEAIPGIGVIGATAIVATVTDPAIFRSGRDFAAWIGLVPRQGSTGGKQKLGPISKQGDRYLRRILVVGAIAVLRRAQENPGKYPWLTQLLARRPFKVVAVALANKMARMAWALLAHGGTYRAPRLAETA